MLFKLYKYNIQFLDFHFIYNPLKMFAMIINIIYGTNALSLWVLFFSFLNITDIYVYFTFWAKNNYKNILNNLNP